MVFIIWDEMTAILQQMYGLFEVNAAKMKKLQTESVMRMVEELEPEILSMKVSAFQKGCMISSDIKAIGAKQFKLEDGEASVADKSSVNETSSEYADALDHKLEDAAVQVELTAGVDVGVQAFASKKGHTYADMGTDAILFDSEAPNMQEIAC